MHNDNNDNKTKLGNLEKSIDRVLYGPETLQEAKFERIIKRRKNKNINHAK